MGNVLNKNDLASIRHCLCYESNLGETREVSVEFFGFVTFFKGLFSVSSHFPREFLEPTSCGFSENSPGSDRASAHNIPAFI